MPKNIASAPTGIDGVDDILGGGIPRNHLYLIEGDPGTGKTTMALQILLEAVKRKETALYITLSESNYELHQVADSHGWDLTGLNMFELSAIEAQLKKINTVFEPSELELDQTTSTLVAEIERVKPSFVVFDSLSELRLLAQHPLRYRKQLLAFKQYFLKYNATVVMVDDKTGPTGDDQILSIAHGVVSLEKVTPDFGVQRRRLQVVKLRGASFRSGYHDFNIVKGGIKAFPRLVAAEHHTQFTPSRVSSGLKALDSLLDGGLDRGTTTLFIGPAGSGKSTVSMQFIIDAARKGERGIVITFEENMGTLLHRMRNFTPDIDGLLESKRLSVRQIDPAEISPGEFAHDIKELVEKGGIKHVLIDSLNGYMNAMPDEKFLGIQMHELLSFLGQQGILTILTMAQHGLMGSMSAPADLSYLADTVVLLRYFEAMGSVRKAVSVIKKRSGSHESTIREYKITSQGVEVGEPLTKFQGVLTGVPTFFGKTDQILTSDAASKPKFS